MTELRARLSHWLERVRDGDEVVVTDRGVPVARLVRLDSAPVIESLHAQGVIGRPAQRERPTASGRQRSTARRLVSERVGEQRR